MLPGRKIIGRSPPPVSAKKRHDEIGDNLQTIHPIRKSR
jgi:hypothetical protein